MVLGQDVFVETAPLSVVWIIPSSTSEDVPGDEIGSAALPSVTLEGKCSVELAGVGVISDFSTSISDLLAFALSLPGPVGDARFGQLVADEVDELLVVLDSGSADDDSVGSVVC